MCACDKPPYLVRDCRPWSTSVFFCGRRSGSQCKARYSNLVALGTAQRMPRAGAARPLSVRLREDYRGAAILPDQPAALTLQMRSRGESNRFLARSNMSYFQHAVPWLSVNAVVVVVAVVLLVRLRTVACWFLLRALGDSEAPNPLFFSFAVPLVPIASAAARQAFSARFTALVKAVQKKPAPPPIPGCDNPEVRKRAAASFRCFRFFSPSTAPPTFCAGLSTLSFY